MTWRGAQRLVQNRRGEIDVPLFGQAPQLFDVQRAIREGFQPGSRLP